MFAICYVLARHPLAGLHRKACPRAAVKPVIWPLCSIGSAVACWREDYNTVRPHSALGNLPPATYAKLSAPVKQRDGALRYVEGYAPRPVASPSHRGSNEARTLL